MRIVTRQIHTHMNPGRGEGCSSAESRGAVVFGLQSFLTAPSRTLPSSCPTDTPLIPMQQTISTPLILSLFHLPRDGESEMSVDGCRVPVYMFHPIRELCSFAKINVRSAKFNVELVPVREREGFLQTRQIPCMAMDKRRKAKVRTHLYVQTMVEQCILRAAIHLNYLPA